MEGTNDFAHNNFIPVPVPEDTGKVSPVIGSGKLEITSAVEVNSTRDYVIKYTAATALDKAYLIVGLPTANRRLTDGDGDSYRHIEIRALEGRC